MLFKSKVLFTASWFLGLTHLANAGVVVTAQTDGYDYYLNLMPRIVTPGIPPSQPSSGPSVNVSLSLHNQTNSDLAIAYSSSCVLDVVLKDEAGQEVKRFLENRACRMYAYTTEVAPGETIEHKETVNLLEGDNLDDGNYLLEVTSRGRPSFSATVPIRFGRVY